MEEKELLNRLDFVGYKFFELVNCEHFSNEEVIYLLSMIEYAALIFFRKYRPDTYSVERLKVIADKIKNDVCKVIEEKSPCIFEETENKDNGWN